MNETIDVISTRRERYEAIPFQFHDLSAELAKLPELAVKIVRGWYSESSELFQFRGGRFLANIFPAYSQEFETELIALVRSGSLDDIDFVLGVLRNYEGQLFLHPTCKEIVKALPASEKTRLTEVEIILQSTGVVSGEFGMAQAAEVRKAQIEPWLSDDCEKVRKFAERYVSHLELQIAAEYRRAEQELELRKRDFGEGPEDENEN